MCFKDFSFNPEPLIIRDNTGCRKTPRLHQGGGVSQKVTMHDISREGEGG